MQFFIQLSSLLLLITLYTLASYAICNLPSLQTSYEYVKQHGPQHGWLQDSKVHPLVKCTIHLHVVFLTCTLLFIHVKTFPLILWQIIFCLIPLVKYIVEGLWKLFKVDLPLPHSCCLQDIELLTAAFNNHSTFDAAFFFFF